MNFRGFIRLIRKKAKDYRATITRDGLYLNTILSEELEKYQYDYVSIYYKTEDGKLVVVLKKEEEEKGDVWRIVYDSKGYARIYARRLFRLVREKKAHSSNVEINENFVYIEFYQGGK